ncbi:MAG: hypothetical protein V1672_01175 [Candidatus Diapherotrites archaeon]
MNNKGILFTLMVLLITLSLLTFISVVENGMGESQQLGYVTNFLRVAEKFSNIERNVIRLDKTEPITNLSERVLPFIYVVDDRTLTVTQELPLKESDFNSFYDTINIYEIFEEDQNYNYAYTGIDVSIDTLKNPLWGGISNELVFLVDPFCFQFKESGLDFMSVGGSTHEKCIDTFDFDTVKRFDLNVNIVQFAEDYNTITCNSGPCDGAGWHQEFEGSSIWPYFEIEIIDTECGHCDFPTANKVISGHYNPALNYEIEISCTGASCVSDPITLTSLGGITAEHESNERIIIELKTEFYDDIDKFYFPDFDMNVTESDFNIFITNISGFS